MGERVKYFPEGGCVLERERDGREGRKPTSERPTAGMDSCMGSSKFTQQPDDW